jgi:hypothetical protein
MNNREYKTALGNLWRLTESQYAYGSSIPSCLSLGCTPLNEAIIAALDIIPAFQQANGIQIVNAVFLTDGEGHGLGLNGYYSRDKAFIRDDKTRKVYECHGRRGETGALITLLKDTTGCNTIGIRLHDAKNINNLRWSFWSDDDNGFDRAHVQYKKNGCCTANNEYDEQFIVKGDIKVEFDALEGLGDDASFTKIKNAFLKGNSKKKSSRVIATRLVEIIAA